MKTGVYFKRHLPSVSEFNASRILNEKGVKVVQDGKEYYIISATNQFFTKIQVYYLLKREVNYHVPQPNGDSIFNYSTKETKYTFEVNEITLYNKEDFIPNKSEFPDDAVLFEHMDKEKFDGDVPAKFITYLNEGLSPEEIIEFLIL